MKKRSTFFVIGIILFLLLLTSCAEEELEEEVEEEIPEEELEEVPEEGQALLPEVEKEEPELIPEVQPILPAEARIYFGLFTDRSMEEVDELIGKKPSIIQLGKPWWEENKYVEFPTEAMEEIRNQGAIPDLLWEPFDFSPEITPGADSSIQPRFQLKKIIRGDFDSYIKQFAQDAKAWGHPFFLRFAHEMNGEWYPWSETVNGNSPGEYVQMWRHVHDVFEKECSLCATWVWAPDAGGQSYTPPVDFTELYPGEAYVDWVGLSAYNVEVSRYEDAPWEEFEDIVAPAYEKLQGIAPDKPIFIAETGVVEVRGNKAQWIRNVLPALKTKFPNIKAYAYFDADASEQGFPNTLVDTSPESLRAFREIISDPYFASNEFESITTSPISLLTSTLLTSPSSSVGALREASRDITWHMKGVDIDVSLEDMKEMREAGIVVLTTEWGMDEEVSKARAFLDRAQRAGLKVVLDGGFSDTAWGYDYNVGFSDDQVPLWQENKVKQWVSALKDHPALFGWDIASEDGENMPNGFGSPLWPGKSSLTITQLKKASATVKAADPKHPILLRMHYWDPSPNPFGAGNWFADGIADMVMLNLYSNYAEDRKTAEFPTMIEEEGQRHIDEVRRIDPDAQIWIAMAAFEAETHPPGYFLKPTASNLRRDIIATKALSGLSGIGFLEWGPNEFTAPNWYLPEKGEDLWQVIQEEMRATETG